jgi:hypothetical protein
MKKGGKILDITKLIRIFGKFQVLIAFVIVTFQMLFGLLPNSNKAELFGIDIAFFAFFGLYILIFTLFNSIVSAYRSFFDKKYKAYLFRENIYKNVYDLMDSLSAFEIELFAKLFAHRNMPIHVRGWPKISNNLIDRYLKIVESVDESIIDSLQEHNVISYSSDQINPRAIYEIRITEDFYRQMRFTYKENFRLSTAERERIIFEKTGYPEDWYK